MVSESYQPGKGFEVSVARIGDVPGELVHPGDEVWSGHVGDVHDGPENRGVLVRRFVFAVVVLSFTLLVQPHG